MINFQVLSQIGKNISNGIKASDGLIARYADDVCESIGTAYDVYDNVSTGRDLINTVRSTPEISPNFENKYNETIYNAYNQLPIIANLTENEKNELLTQLNREKSLNTFTALALNEKPSMLIAEKIDLINHNNFDTYQRVINPSTKSNRQEQFNTFIFNKELTKKILEENKDFYIDRIGLDKNTSIDDIYKILISENSPLKNNDMHDIIGITLGYSPINSKIFQLESGIKEGCMLRENINEYKKKLLNYLYSENSPYKNFDDNFQKELATNIRNIGNDREPFNKNFMNYGFGGINFVPDDKFNQQTIRNILNTFNKAQKLSE